MHISSVVIYAYPRSIDEVRGGLKLAPNTELHLEDPQGKFIVTVEAENLHEMVDIVESYRDIPGVICVTPSCHFFDETPLVQKEMQQ